MEEMDSYSQNHRRLRKGLTCYLMRPNLDISKHH